MLFQVLWLVAILMAVGGSFGAAYLALKAAFPTIHRAAWHRRAARAAPASLVEQARTRAQARAQARA
jgi:hypothetical protein